MEWQPVSDFEPGYNYDEKEKAEYFIIEELKRRGIQGVLNDKVTNMKYVRDRLPSKFMAHFLEYLLWDMMQPFAEVSFEQHFGKYCTPKLIFTQASIICAFHDYWIKLEIFDEIDKPVPASLFNSQPTWRFEMHYEIGK